MKKSIKFVYFDVGGVFLDWKKGQELVATKYDVRLEDITCIFDDIWDDTGRGKLYGVAYMARFAPLFNMKEPFCDASDFWTDHHVPMTRVHEFAVELSKIYRLGLLTNAAKGDMKYAMQKKLIPDIRWNSIVDSSVHGVLKPEAKIYEIAEKTSGVSPKEIFFIDDIPEHIEVAKSRGWQGMVFDTNNVEKTVTKLRKQLIPRR